MRLDLLYEVGFRLCAYQLVYNLTTLDKKDSGDAGDAIVDRQLRVMVDIDLTYIDLAVVFFGQFFNDWSDGATRTTPFSPKVYYSQFIGGDYLVLEVGIC
jgi:hypothetical protein